MTPHPKLNVAYPRPGTAVVECCGDQDMTGKEARHELFTRLVDENELVVIDLSPADFVDSSFIHTLLATDLYARRQGTTMRLQIATAPIVERALEISGVLQTLDVVRTREEALR
jgi:anti-sigma B factor antagonist